MAKSMDQKKSPAQVSRLMAELVTDLKTARLRRKISIRAMAEKLGVSASTYVRLEKGKNVSASLLFSALWALDLLSRFAGIIAPEKDQEAIRLEIRRAEQRHDPRKRNAKEQKIEDLDF